MMYYIDKVNTWSPANKKWQEVQRYVRDYSQTLIADKEAAAELVTEIRLKVEALNEAYPRTKRLTVKLEGNFVSCINEDRRLDDQYVFTFHIMNVNRVYKVATIAASEEGGAR